MELEFMRQAWTCQLVYSAKADMIAVIRGIRPPSQRLDEPHVTFMPLEGGVISWGHTRFLQGFTRIADNGESRNDPFWDYDPIDSHHPYFQELAERGKRYAKSPGSDTASLGDLLEAVRKGERVRKLVLTPDAAARNVPDPLPWAF